MSTERTTTADVEVAVDPDTAFKVFTEEMDRWWVKGPINFWDSARAVAIRCESGMGGRLLEVYDQESGDGLELGRITSWEPGELLAWDSSIDDVQTTVRFLPAGSGTRVVVESRVPAEGRDEGGSSWARVAPTWFGLWTTRRQTDPAAAPLSRLAMSIKYAKPVVAARWVMEVTGLEPSLPLPADDEDYVWIEFRVGNGLLVLNDGEVSGEPPIQTHAPWIFVDDLESRFAAAQTAGAKVVQDIAKHGYTAFVLEDPEGHHWTIAQALPSMRTEPL